MSGVAFFVCGTPSNHRGFELVELGPEKLPGSPETYLDKAPPQAAECHRIESVVVDGQRHVQCSRVLRINPNDAEANRGAYIAVGCLLRERLPLHAIANCLDAVAELYGRVASALTPDRAFPAGFRLADFEHSGSPLDERAAHHCSPLLVADVVLQALNGEGPVDWAKAKEVELIPAQMTSADAGRYQLYSREGLLGSLASLDLDRARAQQTAQRAAAAAQSFVELQHEWAALEESAQRLLAKGEAFRHLALDAEGAVSRDRKLGSGGDSRAEGRPLGPRPEGAGAVPYERPHYRMPQAFRIGSSRGRVGNDAANRRRSGAHLRHGSQRSGLGRLALVLTGGLLTVAAYYAVQRWWSPEPTVAAVAPEPDVAEPAESQPTEQQPPENDVARQRAALDQLPNR
jgi:hypothetical protein